MRLRRLKCICVKCLSKAQPAITRCPPTALNSWMNSAAILQGAPPFLQACVLANFTLQLLKGVADEFWASDDHRAQSTVFVQETFPAEWPPRLPSPFSCTPKLLNITLLAGAAIAQGQNILFCMQKVPGSTLASSPGMLEKDLKVRRATANQSRLT